MNLRLINRLFLVSLACSSAACSASSPTEPTPALAQSSSGALTEDKNKSSESSSAEKQMTSIEASKLATQHLALKNRSWGTVTQVTEGANAYEVHFETPEKELRLLGERVLLVDKESGLVTPRKRR